MAWDRQIPIHHLSQCWARSMSPYVIITPQCLISSQGNDEHMCLRTYSSMISSNDWNSSEWYQRDILPNHFYSKLTGLFSWNRPTQSEYWLHYRTRIQHVNGYDNAAHSVVAMWGVSSLRGCKTNTWTNKVLLWNIRHKMQRHSNQIMTIIFHMFALKKCCLRNSGHFVDPSVWYIQCHILSPVYLSRELSKQKIYFNGNL